ncbi:hypothetical protein [Streptomyces collinus]|uniref:hypothetical protein n=1 Tax=Streptomyces collinus TaxID=42684 RepID=UPI0036A46AFC
MATAVTAGQRSDAPLFTELMNRIRVPRPGSGRPRTRPVHVLKLDPAYSSREIRDYLRRRNIANAISAFETPSCPNTTRLRQRGRDNGGREELATEGEG